MFEKKEEINNAIKLSEESARAECDKLLGYFGIVLDAELKKKKEAIMDAIDTVIPFIRTGLVEFHLKDDDGLFVIQNLFQAKGESKKLEYNLNRLATAKSQIKGGDGSSGVEMMHDFLGSLCGLGTAVIKNLKPKDLRASEALAGIFLL